MQIKIFPGVSGNSISRPEVNLTENERRALRTFSRLDTLGSSYSIAGDALLIPSDVKEACAGLVAKGIIEPYKNKEDMYEVTRKGLNARRRL